MKYQLDTIPVWDAYKTDCECPLCVLKKHNEEMYVDSFLGASVMEPDTRVEVNEKGFCATHYQHLFAQRNRLGLALMTHTYMQEVVKSVRETLSSGGESRNGLFARLLKKPQTDSLTPGSRVRARIGKCILCERLDYTIRRYAYTLVHLWSSDASFQAAFAASKGFCLEHLALVCDMAEENLSAKELPAFLDALTVLEEKNLQRVQDELEWFTLKFDYRNQDKPWGNSRDAVERAINKLQGLCVGEDAEIKVKS